MESGTHFTVNVFSITIQIPQNCGVLWFHFSYDIANLNFCTCHYSTDFVSCAKVCSDLFIRTWIRTKWDFPHTWIVMETKLMKRVLGDTFCNGLIWDMNIEIKFINYALDNCSSHEFVFCIGEVLNKDAFTWEYFHCMMYGIFLIINQHLLGLMGPSRNVLEWQDQYHSWSGPGGRPNIKMPSYQYGNPHVKDNMGITIPLKMVFILRRSPGPLRQWDISQPCYWHCYIYLCNYI